MNSYILNDSKTQWQASISNQLQRVELALKQSIVSNIESINMVSQSIVSAGGKRIRPALVMLSYYACGGSKSSERVVEIAAAAELVHTASLLHDDVVDEARQRRGKATANSVWGNKISVLGGDYLLAQAFGLLARSPEQEIIGIITEISGVMAESQVLEMECIGSLDLWKANYWKCIEGKTAAFMSACCECGSVIMPASDEQRAALRDYGLHLGLAFQISDDILDVTGRQSAVGKDLGSDIRAGKYTLPLLLACEKDPGIVTMVTADKGEEHLQELLALLKSSGAVDRAREIAAEQSQAAISALNVLDDSIYRDSLMGLAGYIVHRNY